MAENEENKPKHPTGDPMVDSLVDLNEELKSGLEMQADRQAKEVGELTNLPQNVQEGILIRRTERLARDKKILDKLSGRSIDRINRTREEK